MEKQFAFNVVIIAIGWWIVHVLSARRDRDKARREMVAKSCDSLSSSLSDLMTEARRYHCADRDVNGEQQIKMHIQDIAQSVSGLRLICSDTTYLNPCRSSIRGVRVAVTGKHFEDEHDGALSANDSPLQSIAEEIMRAKRALADLKHSQFK